MGKSVLESTVKFDNCINCGICKVVCPQDAISLQLNKYNEKIPVIDRTKCNNCGQCSEYCPHTKEKFKKEAEKISRYDKPHAWGLQNASYYVAWSKDKLQRQKCCSGGTATELAAYLLKSGVIDGMIHVERLWGHRGVLHYGARLSTSIEEIKEHVSSAYQPIDFSEILPMLKRDKTYLITATPCVIRGLKKLFGENKKYKNINILTCALICSHNTNSQFIDFLCEMNNVSDVDEWKVNIRHKDDEIEDANNFKNHIYTKDKDLLDKNRFESGWTHIWRNYYFAMGACLKCSDFWGYEADISVKDAWGFWAKDPLGKSLVIIRNKELETHFLNSNLETEKLEYSSMENHQKITTSYKQSEAFNKNFKPVFAKCNRKNLLFRYSFISSASKFLYLNFGYKLTSKIMPIVEFVANIGEKI